MRYYQRIQHAIEQSDEADTCLSICKSDEKYTAMIIKMSVVHLQPVAPVWPRIGAPYPILVESAPTICLAIAELSAVCRMSMSTSTKGYNTRYQQASAIVGADEEYERWIFDVLTKHKGSVFVVHRAADNGWRAAVCRRPASRFTTDVFASGSSSREAAQNLALEHFAPKPKEGSPLGRSTGSGKNTYTLAAVLDNIEYVMSQLPGVVGLEFSRRGADYAYTLAGYDSKDRRKTLVFTSSKSRLEAARAMYQHVLRRRFDTDVPHEGSGTLAK